MTFGTSIQTYDGIHATHDNTKFQVGVDWANERLWMASVITGTGYIARYGVISGAEQADATQTSILSGITPPAIGWDSDGNIYSSGPNALNNGSLTKIDGTALTFIANNAYDTPIFGGNNIVTLKYSGDQYILDTNTGNDIINLNNSFLTKNSISWLGLGWLGCARSSITMGAPGSHYGYLLNSPGGGPPDSPDCFIQKINLPAATVSTLATLVPPDFDASWTESYFGGVCTDQADGNIIANVFGVGGSVRNYLVKFNVSTGAQIWKTALSTTGPEQFGSQWSQSRLLHGKLAIIQETPTPTIVVIDTTNGSIISTQTSGLGGITVESGQCFDDTLGAIISFFDWSGGGGGPSPLNGSTAPFFGWAALYVTEAFSPVLATNTHATQLRIWGNYHR